MTSVSKNVNVNQFDGSQTHLLKWRRGSQTHLLKLRSSYNYFATSFD